MKNNLKLLRKAKGFTQSDLAKLTGIHQVDICRLENHQIGMNLKYADKIMTVLNCSLGELIPEMSVKNDVVKENTNPDNVSIDIISATPCCGNGADVSEEVIGKWSMPLTDFKYLTSTTPERVKQMRVVGDSMQPTINEGDYILVDTSHNTFDVEGIYLIRMINGLAVKRLQAGLTSLSIVSDNPNYKPLNASIGEVSIVGKVIKIFNVRSV